MSPLLLSPASALLAHAERLIADSRVLVVGSAEHQLAEHALDRGARLVQVLDSDPRRVAHAAAHRGQRRVSYAQLTESAFRDGGYDCAIVEDVGALADPQRVLLGVKRALSQRGIALLCAPSDEGTSGLLGSQAGTLDLERLEDLALRVFEDAWLLGQAPFVGYSIVSLSLDGPPEPALDNELLGRSGDHADFYVAVCGTREALSRVDFEDMTIVQLPAAPALVTSEASHRARAERASQRIRELEGELKSLRNHGGSVEIEQLTRKLEERDSWIRELEARARTAEGRAEDSDAERERLESDLRTLSQTTEASTMQLRERLDEAERIAGRSQKETRWAESRVSKLEKELEGALSALSAAEAAEATEKAKPSAELEGKLAELQRSEERARVELAKLRSDHARLEAEFAEQETELEETHQELLEATTLLGAARSELAKRAAELVRTRADLETARTEAEGLRKVLEATPPEADLDVSRLEAQLVERGARVLELEEQLRDVDRLARTLAVDLREAGARAAEPEMVERIGALAQTLAEREADLVAAEWTIGELRQRLTLAGP